MKKIFTLFAAASLAACAYAETVEVSVEWPMCVATEVADVDAEGNPITKTVYENAFAPVLAGGLENYLTVGEPVLGSEITWGTPRHVNGKPFALVVPSDKVSEPTAGHTVSFKFSVKEGYTFEPTEFSYAACVVGTNGGQYNLDYTWNGATTSLQEAFHPNRNNEENGYYSEVTLPLTAAAATSEFDATFSIFDLASNKQIGISSVVVKGKLTGDKIEINGINDITVDAANGEAVYYNLNGVRVANPENGLFIKVQGGKATKVVK